MFNLPAKRKNTDCYKWDAHEGTLPFGVADSDYKAPRAVRRALHRRVWQGAFGYTVESKTYRAVVTKWIKERYGYEVGRTQISIAGGIVFAINTILAALTKRGDKVVVQEPVYNAFFGVLKNIGSEVVNNALLFDGVKFSIDFDDLDKKLEGAKVFLFCSPHNPVGRIWSADDVEKVVELCKKHGVLLISDEIHCDFVFDGAAFVSAGRFFGRYENIIVCGAPSKTFNLAGLFTSNIIFNNPAHKKAFDDRQNEIFCGHVNLMGMIAAETAYKKCGGWVKRQNKFLQKNYRYMVKFFQKRLPKAVVAQMDGTYLAFVSLTYLGLDGETISGEMEKHGITLNTGEMYGKDYGGWVRINIACPRIQLKRGLRRIAECCRVNEK